MSSSSSGRSNEPSDPIIAGRPSKSAVEQPRGSCSPQGSTMLRMKPSLILTSAAAALLVLTGCGKSESTTPSASTAPATAAGVKPYPLTVCPVSDEKLGSMGDPVVFVHAGQEIKLCCKNCRKDFDKEPAKYLAKLAAK